VGTKKRGAILTANPCIPEGISPEASDYILKLLVKDPKKHLGVGEGDTEELRRHPFFKVSFSPSHACYLLKVCLNHYYTWEYVQRKSKNCNVLMYYTLSIIFLKDVII
jgi:hypothetical protein